MYQTFKHKHSNIQPSNDMYNNPYIYDLSCNHITIRQSLLDLGSAQILSNPAGAKIFIDYKGDTGLVTPATISDIPVGAHAYKLTYPGYTDIDGVLFIELNQTYTISITMEKSATYFDPTNLVLYTLTASLLMVYFSQRRIEKKEIKEAYEESKEKYEKKDRRKVAA